MEELRIITDYIHSLKPYHIGCDMADHATVMCYVFEFRKNNKIPTLYDISSMQSLLQSVKGKHGNDLLIVEFINILDKMKDANYFTKKCPECESDTENGKCKANCQKRGM